MSIVTTYSQARARLASLMDAALRDRQTVIITRRGSDDVALIAADELRSLEETAHLLRSPRNAQRLLQALERSQRGEGRPMSIEELQIEVGLGEGET